MVTRRAMSTVFSDSVPSRYMASITLFNSDTHMAYLSTASRGLPTWVSSSTAFRACSRAILTIVSLPMEAIMTSAVGSEYGRYASSSSNDVDWRLFTKRLNTVKKRGMEPTYEREALALRVEKRGGYVVNESLGHALEKQIRGTLLSDSGCPAHTQGVSACHGEAATV